MYLNYHEVFDDDIYFIIYFDHHAILHTVSCEEISKNVGIEVEEWKLRTEEWKSKGDMLTPFLF